VDDRLTARVVGHALLALRGLHAVAHRQAGLARLLAAGVAVGVVLRDFSRVEERHACLEADGDGRADGHDPQVVLVGVVGHPVLAGEQLHALGVLTADLVLHLLEVTPVADGRAVVALDREPPPAVRRAVEVGDEHLVGVVRPQLVGHAHVQRLVVAPDVLRDRDAPKRLPLRVHGRRQVQQAD
jgi:hypothetical protein